MQTASDLEAKAAEWLAKGNAAAERGDKARAEKYYEKSERYLVRANKVRRW